MSMLRHGHVVASAREAEALIQEARRLQRRRRRRAGVAILLLAAIAAGAAAFAGLGAGGSAPRTATAGWASPGQIRAFLAAAGRPAVGTFSVTYSVTVGYGGGGHRRADVAAAQSSPGLFYYRQTPSLGLSSPGPRSENYEVFSAVSGSPRPGLAEPGPHGLASAGPGLFSCARASSSSPWSCTGPYLGIGMGTTGELTSPYPPQALFRGLQNAAEIYTGEPAPPATRPQRAFLFTRRLAGRALSCLGFGSPAHPIGTVCLEPNGIIASYDLPTAASYSAYQTATLLAYAPMVENGTFTLPAVPHRSG